jgi:hypothetical protein
MGVITFFAFIAPALCSLRLIQGMKNGEVVNKVTFKILLFPKHLQVRRNPRTVGSCHCGLDPQSPSFCFKAHLAGNLCAAFGYQLLVRRRFFTAFRMTFLPGFFHEINVSNIFFHLPPSNPPLSAHKKRPTQY